MNELGYIQNYFWVTFKPCSFTAYETVAWERIKEQFLAGFKSFNPYLSLLERIKDNPNYFIKCL
jgi:hypothetical protein